jgi:capsular exopolysaccharide synthesis family protein
LHVTDVTESQPLDLRFYARILWRRKWLFLAPVIVVPVAVYLISSSATKVYRASALMNVSASPVGTSLINEQNIVPSNQSVAIAAQLIQTTGVAQAAAQQLPPPRPSPGAILSSISVSVDPNTLFLTITARASNPNQAAAIANAFSSAVSTTQTKRAIGVIDAQIARISGQIATLPKNAQAARSQLSNQIQRLQVLRDAQGSNAQVIQSASPPSSPVSPRPRRDALLGLVIGVLLGIGLVAVAESLDRRVRQPDDLERLSGLPLLTSVPSSSFGRGLDNPGTIEAFRSLRATLEFFNVDQDIRTLLVTSGAKGEGKTMVAVNLAQAYALGGSDVILVDADLRRPTIGSRLDISEGKGLGAVLVGKTTLEQALHEQATSTDRAGRLRVLPAGDVPPNPAELLRSHRMQTLIGELSEMSELLIIDTSPLLAVSDALPLLDRVSGALLVARLGVVDRHELQRLRKLLDAADCRAVGIVATGAKERRSYAKKYSAYAQEEAEAVAGNGSSIRRPLLLGRRRA